MDDNRKRQSLFVALVAYGSVVVMVVLAALIYGVH